MIRRVAILGAGIGAMHLKGYLALPDRFEVAALCDLDTGRAEKVLTEAGAKAEVTDDLEALLGRADIDIIDICLPPHLHASVALRALEAGKHVVCEKPLVASVAEADALVAAAARTGLSVTPVFQYRYGREMAKLRALVAAGLTGTPYAAALETHWDRGAAYYAVDWRGTWAAERGGCVLGHAIHNHDLLVAIMGPVRSVSARLATRVNAIETEDCAAVSFELESGALATSSVTLGAARNTSRLRFVFEHLTVESGDAPYAPAEAGWSFIARDPARQAEVDAITEGLGAVHAGFPGLFEAMGDAMDGQGGAEVTLAQGRASIELVTAIYASDRAGGAPIALPLSADHALYEGWLPDAPGQAAAVKS